MIGESLGAANSAHKCQHGHSSIFLGSRDLLLYGTYVFRSRQGARGKLLSQPGFEVVCSVLSVPQAFRVSPVLPLHCLCCHSQQRSKSGDAPSYIIPGSLETLHFSAILTSHDLEPYQPQDVLVDLHRQECHLPTPKLPLDTRQGNMGSVLKFVLITLVLLVDPF